MLIQEAETRLTEARDKGLLPDEIANSIGCLLEEIERLTTENHHLSDDVDALETAAEDRPNVEDAIEEFEESRRVEAYEAGDWLGPLLNALALEGVEVAELAARTPPHSRERRELVDALVHGLDRAGFKIVRNDR